jgi:hypothetical protein
VEEVKVGGLGCEVKPVRPDLEAEQKPVGILRGFGGLGGSRTRGGP